MILTQQTRDGHDVAVPGIVPKLVGTPGRLRQAAPRLGEHTDAVLGELAFSVREIADLRARKVAA